jgi:hypothetical protein
MGLLGVARANTSVDASPETILLLLLQAAQPHNHAQPGLRACATNKQLLTQHEKFFNTTWMVVDVYHHRHVVGKV